MRWIIVVGMLWLGIVHAESDPVTTLRTVSETIQSMLREREGDLKQSADTLYSVMDPVLAPHIDFMEMSRWVIGRNAWQKASTKDQKAFTEAFHRLLMRTYVGALLSYKDAKILYMPLRGDLSAKRRVQVDSTVQTQGNSVVHVSYRMLADGEKWRVYDIVIEGVSLLKGFQSQFSDQLQREGLNAVTEQIKAHNRSSEKKAA